MIARRSLIAAAVAAIAVFTLAGCETTGSLDPKQANRLSADKALLVFTVSHDRDDQVLFRRGANVKFFVYLKDVTHGKDLPRAFSNMETLSPMMTSTIEGVWGRVFVREVEPGRIELKRWEVIQDNGPMGVRVVQPKKELEPIVFEVRAGTVTYIGNLHAHPLWAKNPFGIDILAGAVPEVRNEAARDLPLVVKEYPALEGRITVAPLRSGPWMPAPGG